MMPLPLNVKKENGTDYIQPEFLRRYAEWVSHYLCVILSVSLSQCTLPFDWRTAPVVPISEKKNIMVVQLSSYIADVDQLQAVGARRLLAHGALFRIHHIMFRRSAQFNAASANSDAAAHPVS